MKDEKNPISEKDKKMVRVAPELETDAFEATEQKEIVRMVIDEAESDMSSMEDWVEHCTKDLQMYEGESPSVIEDLDKEDWQSDRNLNLCAATCDTYQATLLATCYNPDKINWQPTEDNDVDRTDNLEKFTKWAVGPQECNIFSEIDDFIHNRIVYGVSYLKVGWEAWYKWVDIRIPKYKGLGPFKKIVGYKIETVKKRFERGFLKNIDNVSDLLMPKEGKTLADKHHLIEIIHMTAADVISYGERGIFTNVDEEYKRKLRKYCYDNRYKALDKDKADKLGIKSASDISDGLLKHFPIDLYERYGDINKNKREEEYRVIIDPVLNVFLSGKPLRKINRKSERPYVGSALLRKPGFVQGKSLPTLIADATNAFNNTYNQKSDFQYVENCPYFFYEPNEENMKNVYELRPGRGFAVNNPKNIYFPNNNRSMAWAQQDYQTLLEIIERLTGAASYFLSSQSNTSVTATRDAIINEKSETRFGLFVKRIQQDVSKGISMLISQYQDWAPPDLGGRVLGEDGKKLFANFSIDTLMGNYDAVLSPDIIQGSKALDREIALWGLETLGQSVWFDPRMNPTGNWELTVNAAKKMGMDNIEKNMPPKPKPQWDKGDLVKKKWTQLNQGEVPEVEEGDDIISLYMGFSILKDTRYFELDKEYQPNFDNFYFSLGIAMQDQMKKMEEEKMASQIAMSQIGNIKDQNISPTSQRPPIAGAPREINV